MDRSTRNQQYDMCIQRKLRSAWAFIRSIWVWSESWLCFLLEALDPNLFFRRTRKTVRIPRLIFVFAWRTCHFLLCSVSNENTVPIFHFLCAFWFCMKTHWWCCSGVFCSLANSMISVDLAQYNPGMYYWYKLSTLRNAINRSKKLLNLSKDK